MAEIARFPRMDDIGSGGVIIKWNKAVGDHVYPGELLVEVDCSKATLDLESYTGGIVLHIGPGVGEAVRVGQMLCIVGNMHEDISGIINESHDGGSYVDSVLKPSASRLQELGRQVFISYSRRDLNFVNRFTASLVDINELPWVDRSDLRVGEVWNEQISEALLHVKCVIVVVSENSLNSVNVREEINYARQLQKKIIPIIIDGSNLPFGISALHGIDFRNNYETSMQELSRHLKS